MPIVLLLNRGLISKSTYSNNVKLAKGNQQYENNQKRIIFYCNGKLAEF